MTRAPDVDALLANADWLTRLSRQLCRDQHAADDAAQEALLASLRSPPRHDGNVRAFLATLLRNVLRVGHRKEARRTRREQRLPPRNFAEAADLVAARAEVHQVLGRLVLELPEPQRTLVLLCYFEGRDVATIAVHARMSRDAVHAHLRRARDTLRIRLQANDAQRWSAPALALLERTLWLAPGVLAMTMKTKVAAAAALAAAALCWWTLPSIDVAPRPDAAGAPEAAAPATAHVRLPHAEAAARVEATQAQSPAPPSAFASEAPQGRLTGRVVDQTGTPVAPARVYAVALRDGKPSENHVLQDDVDDRGRFEMPVTFDGDVLVVGIPLRTIPGSTGTGLHESLVAVASRAIVNRQQLTELPDLVCESAVAITGIVREPDDRGVPGVHVGWQPDDVTWSVILDQFAVNGRPDERVHVVVAERRGGSAFSGGIATDAEGRFTIATSPGTRGWIFLMNPQSAHGDLERLVPERSVRAPAIVTFDLLAPACVRVLADGRPVANAEIHFDVGPKEDAFKASYRSDAAGEIRILRERLAPIRGRTLRPGREPLEFDVPDHAIPANPLVVELGSVRTTAVQLVVTSERPLRGLSASLFRVDVRPTTSLGMLQEPGPTLVSLRADIPPGPYRLVIGAARGAEGDDAFVMRQLLDVTVGGEPVSMPVRAQHGGRIRVTVTTKDGQHVEGTVRLVDPAGAESKPSMHSPGRGNGESGKLWAPGPLTTSQVLTPGRYEVIVDHGARGTHRRFVDVRACEVADFAITLQ